MMVPPEVPTGRSHAGLDDVRTGRIVGLLALIVALVVPLGSFLDCYVDNSATLELKARRGIDVAINDVAACDGITDVSRA
jgi:hypothetical protein